MLPPLSQPGSLGPYRLLRKLGEGGMGLVYLAHDSALDRHVAIKLLRTAADPASSHHATLAKRFLREARSAARISHPHVALIYAVGEHANTAGQPYLVMEYLDAGSLAHHLRDHGPLHWRDALEVTRHALLGLAAAHAQGVIHRDIKPANLMRSHLPDGTLTTKLVDFGLARIAAAPADHDLTFPGAFVGSPHYAAPEQISAAKIDGRADLYALAATTFALITGQPPFLTEGGDDPADTLHHHLHSPFPNLRDFAPNCPPTVQKLLTRASAKNPADRFPSAAKMLQAVETILDEKTPGAMLGGRAPQACSAPNPPEPPSTPTAHKKPPKPKPQIPDLSTIHDLESQLASARQKSDSSTQLQTLRSLVSAYTHLQRPQDAHRAFREALVLHIRLNAPSPTPSPLR